MDEFNSFIDQDEEFFLDVPPNGISLTEDDCVYKIIIKPGDSKEKPPKGSKVTVHYTGKLEDGSMFDSSHNHGQKFSFNVGRSEVIKAWDICIASMQKGEKCELHCSPQYGYGSRGSPPKIPPNAVLIFEIELFEWEGEDLSPMGDKGIMRETIDDGEEFTMPNIGAFVRIEVQGKYQGKVFDERTIEYNVAEADPTLNLVPAIDETVKRMKRKGRCRIDVKPKYGFGDEGCEKFGIPPDADLEYFITLKEFEKAKESWEMIDPERLEQSIIAKDKGTELLKAGKLELAVFQYKKILDYLEHHDAKADGSEDDKKILKDSKDLKLKGLLNLAFCYLKLKDFTEVEAQCVEALKLDPENEKGIYRLGEAFFNQRNFKEAKNHFMKVCKLYPRNKEARKMLDKCAAEEKKAKETEKLRYKGMFEKFSKNDKEDEIRKQVNQQKEKKKAKDSRKVSGSKQDEPAEGAKSQT